MKTAQLKIGGMHCHSCAQIIEDSIAHQAGVQDAKISLKTNSVYIHYDETAIDQRQLITIIASDGFEVQPL
jgi:Cu+-exporting ATPase